MSARKTDETRDKATVDAKAGGTMAGGAAGAVIGGVVGGPVGAGIGGVVGSAIGGAAGSALDYNSAEPEFRNEWERVHHKAGSTATWEDASSAYRYGWESHDRTEYQGRTWDEVHPHLQQGWTGQGNWTEYEPLVRSAWDRRAERPWAPRVGPRRAETLRTPGPGTLSRPGFPPSDQPAHSVAPP